MTSEKPVISEQPVNLEEVTPVQPVTPAQPGVSDPLELDKHTTPANLTDPSKQNITNINKNTKEKHSLNTSHGNGIQFITTYSSQPAIEVYQLNSKNEITKIKNMILAPATNEYSEAIVTIAGLKYYRISNNRLIRITDAYIYTPINLAIKVNTDKYINIFTAEGYLIGSEKLTDITLNIDAFTYINGEKYYRISTNKFVRASDVSEY
ncbi:hypothetical protein FD31_GL002241 [Companilactobacillus nantensis DSM 16982]|uniref:S-layer protein C-terminal domain-containing protein n=1 Tax=Companilactobacillus nantensis DSM 16982 TaxID=1423774 RepID=A0A0R1WD73_9LACO|nr:hypothetical protein FD31_GL002241 [Companilactobacillus nantensis DSM 16982]